MAGTIEGIKALNSVVRTLLVMAGVGVVGYGGYLGYNQYVVPASQAKEAIAKLEEFKIENFRLNETVLAQGKRLDELEEKNEKLQTSLKLIKMDRRLAHVTVKKMDKSEDGVPFMDVDFSEMDRDGKPLGEPRSFHLAGDKLYVDCWLVKFEDQYIEDGNDDLRNATLCVFKGIWGDLDGPAGGMALDDTGKQQVPVGYADSPVTDFEKKIWYDFWSVANSIEKQRALGIRAAHGQVDYVLAEEGQVYLVELRASDGVTLRPAVMESAAH